ncbi:MAG: BlaI/MecI/CopY family transcriptional regulator [Eubacteriales bacterium]|nr:BlaI/MecI/CopY family transcriptional regulator [Eubacteriales bacterium]
MKETLTYPEWMVMSALWGKPPQTLSEVIAAMGDAMDWSYRTYASYLNKLCEKGLAGFEAKGRDRFYYPLVDKAQCIRAESRSLLKKVSEQSAKELLVCMIEESGLSAEDHEELKKLLDELAKGSDGK